MTTRKPRRALFAELLLTGSPSSIMAHADGTGLSVAFDSVADLYAWLDAAGLNTPGLLTGESTRTDPDDGHTWRTVNAYPTWHGWEIYARARDQVAAAPLDEQMTAALVAVAGVA